MPSKTPKEAAELIRDKVEADFEVRGERDRSYLEAVCAHLKLEPTLANRIQVFTLLKEAGVDTRQAYPKAKYKALPGMDKDARGQAPYQTRVVDDEKQEQELGADWSDTVPTETVPMQKGADVVKAPDAK